MKINKTKLEGVFIVESDVFADKRGQFSRLFCKRELSDFLEDREIVQINRSLTVDAGIVRGFHYQSPPFCEKKIIRCLQGTIWDVALDLRKDSPTFKQWIACELTQKNNLMIMIPEGVAHGFQTLKTHSEILYLHTEYYSPEHEGGIKYDDPSVNVSWPLPVHGVSDRDLSFSALSDAFKGIEI